MDSLGIQGTIRLRDGRQLAYAQWGDPRGLPVLHFHGTPGSRLDRHHDDSLYSTLSLRYITIDRPGYGRSDPKPDLTFLDWADDVEQLADALEIERFRILAVSGGSAFAAGTCLGLAERVDRAAIVSGVGPADRPGSRKGMALSERLTYTAPGLAGIGLSVGAKLAQRNPALATRMFGHGLGPDRVVLERPEAATLLRTAFTESLRQGPGAAVHENALYARPWGFRPEDVTTEIQLWHGDRDRIVPLHHAEDLAYRFPNASLTVLPGAGHLVVVAHAERILRALIA
jgi:pimeloyl-ACP methyl ester carboxylesterase